MTDDDLDIVTDVDETFVWLGGMLLIGGLFISIVLGLIVIAGLMLLP